jgi:hypothetical protein
MSASIHFLPHVRRLRPVREVLPEFGREHTLAVDRYGNAYLEIKANFKPQQLRQLALKLMQLAREAEGL